MKQLSNLRFDESIINKMKTLKKCAILVFFGIVIFNTNDILAESPNAGSGSDHPTINAIDAADSVIFELSQSISQLSTIEFPVYFVSDDTINAVDFSLKFDQTMFQFDTITNLISALQVMAYYNTSDSTLRFTSNSLQTIPGNVPIVKVRFTAVSGLMCASDLTDVITYLNGDQCSSRVENCVANSISENSAIEKMMTCYPNPAIESLNIDAKMDFKFTISDVVGKIVFAETELLKDQNASLDVSELSTGIYFINIKGNGIAASRKVIITH